MKIFKCKKSKIENGFCFCPKHTGRRPVNEITARTCVFAVFSLVFPYFVLIVLMNINKLVYKDVVVWCRGAYRHSCSCIPKLFGVFCLDAWPECVSTNVFIGKAASYIVGRTWPATGRLSKWE